MSRFNLGTYSLFAAITVWGILLGGIVYAHIVYFPPYLSDLPNSAVVVNGKYGLNEGAFWMTVHPLLILSLACSLIFNWKFQERRKLILMSVGIYIVVLITTALYFLPELSAFRQSPELNVSAAEWLNRGNRWQYLSWIRGIVMFVSFFSLLFALTKQVNADEYLNLSTG